MLLIITQEWSNIHFNTVKIKANLRDNTVQVMVLANHILPLPTVTFCSCWIMVMKHFPNSWWFCLTTTTRNYVFSMTWLTYDVLN